MSEFPGKAVLPAVAAGVRNRRKGGLHVCISRIHSANVHDGGAEITVPAIRWTYVEIDYERDSANSRMLNYHHVRIRQDAA